MRYTLLWRDEQGNEIEFHRAVVSELMYKTVFVCPKDGRLSNIEIEIIKNTFESAGVTAIVANLPLELYQIKPNTQ